ncbi:MAG: glycine cleavage T C-terminal barrel domain-containing protein, partial [bacterium]
PPSPSLPPPPPPPHAGIAIHFDSTISAVQYARGRITQVAVMALSADGDDVRGDARTLDCDAVAVSGGWTPTVHLLSQAKIELAFSDRLHCLLPAAVVADDANDDATRADAPLPNPRGSNSMFCAGACRGAQYIDECLTQGRAAGRAAAAAAGFSGDDDDDDNNDDESAPRIDEPRHGRMRPLWILPCDHPIGRGPKKHFHELHNDSTVADIALAAREGFDAVEHLKRYTTTGMGTDQGKTSNLNALAALAALRGDAPGALGATTFRPPYTPLTFGAIIGHERRELFLQQRTTPMHPSHNRRGAVYEDVGDWKRPRYFPTGSEDMHAAVQRETLAARNAVGVLDASTLGKIDIQGEDATRLLDMVYTNAWSKLNIGACRYGLMLNEHGMVFDDGVTTRIGENHFHMTTTTGGAARVLNWLEEWLQTEWPHLKVYCTSVTEQWAVASISGPNSRALLAELCDQPLARLARESFPFMTMQQMEVAGIPARVFRIGFTGELAFEINVPARFGLALWRALMRAGERHGICAYGTEAMHVLRAEKGFIIVGQDTDGTVTPLDLGMDWIVSKTKADFIGKRSLTRSDTARAGRKQLVGLLSEDPNRVLPEGAHAVAERRPPPMEMLGHISSSYMSPNLGRSIALGLIADGLARKGESIEIALTDGTTHRATIVDSVFLDPSGERARG